MNGFSFIEILITLLILSLGLLTIAGMEIVALRNTQQVYLRSVATVQIAAMLERLRANQAATARNAECQRWNAINQQLLPEANGECHCDKNICNIILTWHDHAKQQQLSLQANI